MKDVEHFGPVFQWANEIEVEHRKNHFRVRGHILQAAKRQSLHRDLLAEYRKAVARNQAGDEQKAPHFIFANARSTEDLLAFVKRFGPVCGEPRSLRLERPPLDKGAYVEIELSQNVETLRREQLTFASMFALYNAVHSPEPGPEAIFELARTIQLGSADWVRQFEEQEADASRLDGNLHQPSRLRWQELPWRWSRDRQVQVQMWVEGSRSTPPASEKAIKRCVAGGHMVLCQIFNAFPLNLARFENSAMELPGQDLLLGIRHVLYYLLRCDYLEKSQVAQCAWKECRKWFRVTPQESPCCCAEHALKHRQWKYYHESKAKKTRVTRRHEVQKAESKTTNKRRK